MQIFLKKWGLIESIKKGPTICYERDTAEDKAKAKPRQKQQWLSNCVQRS